MANEANGSMSLGNVPRKMWAQPAKVTNTNTHAQKQSKRMVEAHTHTNTRTHTQHTETHTEWYTDALNAPTKRRENNIKIKEALSILVAVRTNANATGNVLASKEAKREGTLELWEKLEE